MSKIPESSEISEISKKLIMNENLISAIQTAIKTLENGGVAAFPTETVYGLGAVIECPTAVANVYKFKSRPANHPLIVHVPDDFDLSHYAKVTPLATELIKHFWPGPLTLVLEKTKNVPDNVTGGQNSVALRSPNHPIAQAILKGLNHDVHAPKGVAAPSANRFGRISPTRHPHVCQEFSTEIAQEMIYALDGDIFAIDVGIESTIVDARGDLPIILRHGSVSLEDIQAALNIDFNINADINLNKIIDKKSAAKNTRVSGDMLAHYAPSHDLYLIDEIDDFEIFKNYFILKNSENLENLKNKNIVLVLRQSTIDLISEKNNIKDFKNILILPDEPKAYAQKLYATLREADELLKNNINNKNNLNDINNTGLIIWQKPINCNISLAINDRLQKASHASMLKFENEAMLLNISTDSYIHKKYFN